MEFLFVKFDELKLPELYAILKLRELVFVLEQACLYPDIDGKDSIAYHVLLKEEGKLIAYARYFTKGSVYPEHASIGRVVVDPEYRGKELGKLLMKSLLEKVDSLYKNTSIQISAQTYLIDFYESYGFKIVSAEYLEDAIPHIRMLRS